ncbi:L-ascorbate metabolism protein UlaG (beta-lactamase superfamily) [Dyadobacter sp. BE34]|uniref:L-ascorbate metabolism protein UlaG (Beta-lactamase superfamily) n=1 Tax=Dyadobacter fermentans TaxID=94254 RepID=A0ABU1QY44_9BACT|nr:MULTISPECIES: MBL fold metallo-hydrolase [Dyadobacter]MDR6805922.1 L-ascorbate metabolism protein UlaG (beta-lactamase superfamily) [Dyadobacter fermentans]MDR7042317.1 L-ascorbate metabolism protein UlaG (beta-lactamase superfamily) [Dyadobacter sp. BE242]MDR7201315.1 L-ascorbate metabolism protein UlaG (beta-lactamase superfamily) [Dyadobacter sp. BE34]MDR7215936.1 L-ascorbate metabolism protein UlaG (beta-lactamase superfamily) [Dyadobacter sp. BE31]MDR7263472.1 L-ascorbate metabolism pr
MKLQRLSWAGLKVESNGQILLIDAVQNYQRGAAIGPEKPFQFVGNTAADVVLITHLHSDHYDPEAIRSVLKPEGRFVVSEQIAAEVTNDGFAPLALALNAPQQIGNFTVTAVFAMDGVGDKQVSWVIEADGQRILHGGDTMWHNQFWQLGKTWQHFDAVFLPVNGAVVNIPRVEPSPVPITLTPIQAITVTRLLHADVLVPIHYGFHKEGMYHQFPDMEAEIARQAEVQNVKVQWVEQGNAVAKPVAAEQV